MPSVNFIDFPESPFALISGSSPEFAELLSNVTGFDALSTLKVIAPYFVVIKNQSTATVRSITIIWTTISSGGQGRPNTLTYVVKPGVRPGEMVLMAPISGLTLYLSANSAADQGSGYSGPDRRDTSRLNQVMANFLRNFTEEPGLSISLDSVIFRDGRFLGPDHADKFEEENRERQMIRKIVTELLNRAPPERSAYLDTISHDPQATPSLITSEVAQMLSIVECLRHMAADRGDEDLFRRSMENIINDETQPLRRRTR